MNDRQSKYNLIYSTGKKEIVALLKKQSKKKINKELEHLSAQTKKALQKYKQALETQGIPSNLHIALISAKLDRGVFLRPKAKPILPGDFIGIYTGTLELVPSGDETNNLYSYDAAQHIKLSKEQLSLVTGHKKVDSKEEFSIQVNASKSGNFTRFINHSSSETNVEAIATIMPDDTIEIILYALTKILPGDQLLSNYGGAYWRALSFIPDDVKPDTYVLGANGKLSLLHPSLPLKKNVYDYLLNGRNVAVEDPKGLFSSGKKQRIPTIRPALQKQVEDFEEIVLERGIPYHYHLTKRLDWRVTLSAAHATIPKGAFVAVYAGTIRKNKKKSGLVLTKMPEGTYIKIDAGKKGNFTKDLPLLIDGNLSFKLYKDKEGDLKVLLLAKRAIHPGDTLSLSASAE